MRHKVEKSLEASLNYWNNVFLDPTILSDEWLDGFKLAINGASNFVDLGCGNGNNVRYLLGKGKTVDACDQSPVALGNLKQRFAEQVKNDKLHLYQFNFMDKCWPLVNDGYQIAIADLSLHYFLPEDFAIVLEKVWFLLKDGNGRLIFRFNSKEDPEFIANQGRQIKPGIILTDSGMIKQYFSHSVLRAALGKRFTIEELRQEHMTRYGKDKVVWRGCARANYKSWYYPQALNKSEAYHEFKSKHYDT